jgi:glycerol kinase
MPDREPLSAPNAPDPCRPWPGSGPVRLLPYALDGGVYAAGSAVNWARELGLFQDFAEISNFAKPAAIDRTSPLYPRLPDWAVRTGTVPRGGPGWGWALGPQADMMQALLEGVALRTAEVLAAMNTLHAFDGAVSVDGGLSRNGYFLQFLAEVAGHDLLLAAETEQTAAGLAWMAAEAAGLSIPPSRPGRLLRAGSGRRDERLARFTAARRAVEGYAEFSPGTG